MAPRRKRIQLEAETREALEQLLTQAIESPSGWQRLHEARTAIVASVMKTEFNTERAVRVFSMAIEKAVWDKFGSIGAITTRSIRDAGVVEARAMLLVAEFKANTNLQDQRPARRGFLAALIGK
jgi:hypothetical protein